MPQIINAPTRMSRTMPKKARMPETPTEAFAPLNDEELDALSDRTAAALNQDTSTPEDPQPENLEALSPSVPDPAPVPPQPQPQPGLPLAIALPQACRRVREAVLPFWYFHAAPTGPGAQDPAVVDYIQMMNAALTTAEQAMITQDVGLMQFAFRSLSSFTQVPAPPDAAPASGGTDAGAPRAGFEGPEHG